MVLVEITSNRKGKNLKLIIEDERLTLVVLINPNA